MVRRVGQVAILIILGVLLIMQGLSGFGQIGVAAAQADTAACTDGYALWSSSASAFSVLDWSGSDTHVQGKVRSNWAIRISGSSNVIDDTVEYVSSFVDSGDDNQYPAPVQVAPAEMPVSFDIDDYGPGGSAAEAAEQAGRYHYISGDLEVGDDDDDELRDGLYYVTGNVEIDADNLDAQVTIVARGDIEISSAEHDLSPYSGGLLLFSGAMRSWDDVVKISGGDNVFQGLVYAPGGRVEVSGSENLFRGGLFARTLQLNGSSLTIFYEDSYCQTAPTLTPPATATTAPTLTPPATATTASTPTPPATATPAPTPTATRTPTPGPGPTTGPIFLPLAGVQRDNQTGEPNNLCGQAYYISSGVTYAFLAEDAQDWYTFDLASPGEVTVELRNFVPLQGQIAAYRGDNCLSTTFLQNNGDSTLDKTLVLGSQPAGRYFLFVGNDGPLNSIDPYTLTIVVR